MIAELTIHLSDNVLWFIAGFVAFPVAAFIIFVFVAVMEGDV